MITAKTRISLLRKKIKSQHFVKIIEAHNGISGLIANGARVTLKNKKVVEFDGIWESSLTDSASKGLPDTEIVDRESRLHTINQILAVTTKPMIVDGDTGGTPKQFTQTVKKLEAAGVSMVAIEDKIFPKRNSFKPHTVEDLEKAEVFAKKIKAGVAARRNPNFMIVARLESLIAGSTIEDALERGKFYLHAGADGLIIHTKEKNPAQILAFAKLYYSLPKGLIKNKVLGCIPTTYNTTSDQTLVKAGFHIIIHANHLLRAALLAMEQAAQKILLHDRSFEADADSVPVEYIFEKIK